MLKYSYDLGGNLVAASELGIPQIVGQPITRIGVPGGVATFSVVVADARAVAFQWQRNGFDLPGATGDSLVLTQLVAADEGQYAVVVTNPVGSATSASAALLLDSTGNGLPDRWELATFGDLTSQRSGGDADGDGISNIDEFFDGTDPTSATSQRPRLVAFGDVGGTVTAVPTRLAYSAGESVTLTAVPSASRAFVGWAGDLGGTSNPATITMDRSKKVRARFASVAPLPAGLLALWRGEPAADGMARDVIGGHDGAFHAGGAAAPPAHTADGKVGGAFAFDGAVHVRVPPAAALRPAAVTVEAWVYPTLSSSQAHHTVIASGSAGNDDNAWWMGVYDGRPRFWSKHVGAGMQLVEAATAVPLHQWTHLAASFDGATKRLYVNGVQVAWQGGLGALVYEGVPVTIGADWAFNAAGHAFHGRLDEIGLYARALSADEVASIYSADVLGKDVERPYFTSPSQLPEVALGAGYTQSIATILGAGSVHFSVVSGALPPGMTLSAAGVVSGAPGFAGTFDVTVRATDAAGAFTDQLFVLRVLQPVAAPADLVAWWRGDAPTGNAVPDLVGGHDGAFFGGPPVTTDGKVGRAFTFDGALHVRVSDAAGLRPSAVTAEAWMSPSVENGSHQAVIASGSSTNDDNAWWIGVLGGRPRFWSKHAGSGMHLLEASVRIPLHQWTHIAASFDGAIKRLYVDGAEVAAQAGLGALVYDPAPVPVTIGADWGRNTACDFFQGRIDEPSLYRRALSADEIRGIVDAGGAGKAP